MGTHPEIRATGSNDTTLTRHDSNRHSCKPECFRRLPTSRGQHATLSNSSYPVTQQLSILFKVLIKTVGIFLNPNIQRHRIVDKCVTLKRKK